MRILAGILLSALAESLRVMAVLGVLLILVLAVLLRNEFYSLWIHGWGNACNAFDASDTPSPSKDWIARRQHVACGSLAGGYSLDVVLVPAHPLFPFLARERRVFGRALSSPGPQDDVEILWKDDHNLEIAAAACDDTCKVITPVETINVSVNAPAH